MFYNTDEHLPEFVQATKLLCDHHCNTHSVLFSGLYQYLLWPATEENHPNMSFFISSIITLISFGLTLIIKFKSKPESDTSNSDEEGLV